MIVLSAEFVKSAADARGWPPAGPPEFAFCGRSNVGKSSALNALAARKSLARVSRTPGRTRLINFFDLRVAEKTRSGGRGAEQHVVFADLPGYGFASGPREERESWRPMIEEYLTRREPLRAHEVQTFPHDPHYVVHRRGVDAAPLPRAPLPGEPPRREQPHQALAV